MKVASLVLTIASLLCLSACKDPLAQVSYRRDIPTNSARVRSTDPQWQRAEREVLSAEPNLESDLRDMNRQRVSDHILRNGSRTDKVVALTFDDGPHPTSTPKLLQILKEEDTVATFFVVGFMAKKHPELVWAINKNGHAVANHSYSHATLTHISLVEVMTEYRATNEVIKRITGVEPRYCRPPGGKFSPDVLRVSTQLGLTTTLWTNDPADYASPSPEVLYDRLMSRLTPGCIVMLHDGPQNTINALPRFIQSAKAAGYRFVSLDELR